MSSRRVPLEGAIVAGRPIVERIVWATVTTVGAGGLPRSRILHPVWTWTGAAPSALVATKPTPIKLAHLATNPVVSCLYWDPAHDTVAIDARARWIASHEVADAWEQVKATPAPVGFDPAIIWPEGPADPECAFLHLSPHRILVTRAGEAGLLWQRSATSSP